MALERRHRSSRKAAWAALVGVVALVTGCVPGHHRPAPPTSTVVSPPTTPTTAAPPTSTAPPTTTPPSTTTTTAPPPGSGDSGDSPCDGSTGASYSSACGPSLTVPTWGDASGWDDVTRAESITLFDLDGDGLDELIGQGANGLLVDKWSNELGQWAPMSDLRDGPLPFPEGSYLPGTLRIGLLAPGLAGAVAAAVDGSGLVTWSWSPGDDPTRPGSGTWTLEDRNGPFDNSDPTTQWGRPGYVTTLQFVPGGLAGLGYGVAARGADGIHFCAWDVAAHSWSCSLVTSAFNDSVMRDDESTAPAEYYVDTIQFGDIYAGAPGVELFGRDMTGDGVLKVYTWDEASRSFVELSPSGNWPFWSPDGEWDDVSYSSTIQPVQLVEAGAPEQVIGRSAQGLQWFRITDEGCAAAAPCWESLTNFNGQVLGDLWGYDAAQYYETIRFADIDGDGLDEVLARAPGGADGFTEGALVTWKLGSLGWQPADWSLDLAAGPADDPLWSNPTYYKTIHVGAVTPDHRPTLVARGKYGIRTWMFWEGSGWDRPYPYGFEPFDGDAQAAYELVGEYLGIVEGSTIRDAYSSQGQGVLVDYADCLAAAAAFTALPTTTCPEVGESTCIVDSQGPQCPEPTGVTLEAWRSMVALLQQEVGLAVAVNSYFLTGVHGIIQDLFVLEQDDFDDMLADLFPDGPPSGGDGLEAVSFFDLFIQVGEAFAALAGGPAAPVVNAGLHIGAAVIGSLPLFQTRSNPANTFDTTVAAVRTHIADIAADALDATNAMFDYVVGDRGLLYLYGTLVSDQYWQIEATQHDAAISQGQLELARWVYQTMLPLKWTAVRCAVRADGDGGSLWPCPHFTLGENAFELYTAYNQQMGADLTWYGYLGWAGSEGFVEPIDTSDPLYTKVFGPVSSACSTSWSLDSCNAGMSVSDAVTGSNGWALGCTGSDTDYPVGCSP